MGNLSILAYGFNWICFDFSRLFCIYLFHLYKLCCKCLRYQSNQMYLCPLATQAKCGEKNKKNWYSGLCDSSMTLHITYTNFHNENCMQLIYMYIYIDINICVKCVVSNKFCETIHWHRISNRQTYSSSSFIFSFFVV